MRLIVLQQPAKMPSVPALRAEASGQEGEQSRELNLKFSSLLQSLSSPWEMDLPYPFNPHMASCHVSLRAWEQHVCFKQSTFESFPFTQRGFPFTPESKGNGLCVLPDQALPGWGPRRSHAWLPVFSPWLS